MSKLQFIIPLNTSLGPVTSRCNRVVGDPWKVFQPCPYNFRFDEDWDVQLPESPLPLLRVGVLAVWFDPCSNNSAAFDDRNALISITRAITRGDRRFAFQDGGQDFCDSIASWVYNLVPCFPDQAKSIWRPCKATNLTCVPNRELLSKYRIILLSSIYAICWNGENVWRLKLFIQAKIKVAEHSFQEPMPNSPYLLNYKCFGAHFLH